MKPENGQTGWRRRAQPLLGTLVEVGIRARGGDQSPAFEAAFAQIRRVQHCLSRFDSDSDLGRFQAMSHGEHLVMRPATKDVLAAARELYVASGGGFDISLGTSPQGWRCEGERLYKLDDAVRLDLGGIGKGYAVDCAVQALVDSGCEAGWVNAGGDLRSFGDVEVPVRLRAETTGGVRDFAALRDGAFATSHFGPSSRSQLACETGAGRQPVHASVAAPLCLWADALTKVVARSGNPAHPLLSRYDAVAWIH